MTNIEQIIGIWSPLLFIYCESNGCPMSKSTVCVTEQSYLVDTVIAILNIIPVKFSSYLRRGHKPVSYVYPSLCVSASSYRASACQLCTFRALPLSSLEKPIILDTRPRSICAEYYSTSSIYRLELEPNV